MQLFNLNCNRVLIKWNYYILTLIIFRVRSRNSLTILIRGIRNETCSRTSITRLSRLLKPCASHHQLRHIPQITREWEEYRNNRNDPPTLDIFLTFLTNRADLLETLEEAKNNRAMVKVLDGHGKSHAARVLLDNGSTGNFVTKEFCAKLNLLTNATNSRVTGINQQKTKWHRSYGELKEGMCRYQGEDVCPLDVASGTRCTCPAWKRRRSKGCRHPNEEGCHSPGIQYHMPPACQEL
ncbi:uncharacterized protein LOC131846575 [Achroia grisella]|uniref:uncharacterized protein LOC131846575 n=1 Tax=Achroia grisella TaxID=688607 RepID=UPI0027D213A4|nr:uncharacterized protein LOC131846575 [Achroia grisella]